MQNKEEISKKHTQLPNNMGESKLEIKDQLIYLVIKSHNNSNNECFPSLQTIAEESGISIPTIRVSIKRLEEKEFIKIERRGRKNYYFFNPYKTFEPFSDEFIKRKDLSPLTKSYLIAIQQYMYKDIEGIGKISLSNRKIAEKINTTEHTVRNCNKELERKNYLTIINNKSRDLETGCKTDTKLYDLNKLGQAIIWTLKDHEDRITENTENIKELAKRDKLREDEHRRLVQENKEYIKLVKALQREIEEMKKTNQNNFVIN